MMASWKYIGFRIDIPDHCQQCNKETNRLHWYKIDESTVATFCKKCHPKIKQQIKDEQKQQRDQEVVEHNPESKLFIYSVYNWDFVLNKGELIYETNDFTEASEHAWKEASQYCEDEKPTVTRIDNVREYRTNCDYGAAIIKKEVK